MVQPSSELDDLCLLSLPGESQPKVANPQVAGSNPAGRTVPSTGFQKGTRRKVGSFIYSRICNGDVAEWSGRGLQSLLRRFESARHLCLPTEHARPVGFFSVTLFFVS